MKKDDEGKVPEATPSGDVPAKAEDAVNATGSVFDSVVQEAEGEGEAQKRKKRAVDVSRRLLALVVR